MIRDFSRDVVLRAVGGVVSEERGNMVLVGFERLC